MEPIGNLLNFWLKLLGQQPKYTIGLSRLKNRFALSLTDDQFKQFSQANKRQQQHYWQHSIPELLVTT